MRELSSTDFTPSFSVGGLLLGSTLPNASSAVIYQIQAARSTGVGPFAQFNVKFGVSSDGSMMASMEPPVIRNAA